MALRRTTVVAAAVCAVGIVRGAAGQAAAVPYAETFDGAFPPAHWTFATTVPGVGRAYALAPSSVSPASPQGGPHLALDVAAAGITATNDATLVVDLAAAGGGVLRYFAKDTGDEPDPGIDGCFVRDGVGSPWLQIADHTALTGAWTEIVVDLAVVAAAHGLTVSSAFEIRFTQRDNFPVPSDGVQFDHVRVDAPPPADVGQANAPLARLLLPSATNLAGQPPLDGLRGPFFAAYPAGAPLTLGVEGAANRPWILIAGPLQRNALVRPDLGSVDVGFAVGDLLVGFVVVLDGTQPGLLNLFAWTNAVGASAVTLAVPAFPPGTAFALQAAVFDGAAWRATAATEIAVQ